MNSNQTKTEARSGKHSGLQLTGFLLWRFGLLLSGSVGIYRILKFLFQFVDLPIQLEFGLGLMASGVIFFLTSLVLERIYAIRHEGNLREDYL